MIDIKGNFSLNWKATMTMVISLFVFTAFNYDVNTDIEEVVQTELCLTDDFFQDNCTFNPTYAIQPAISFQTSFERFFLKIDIKRLDDFSNLIVANQLTSYNSYKSKTSSHWHSLRSRLVLPLDDAVII